MNHLRILLLALLIFGAIVVGFVAPTVVAPSVCVSASAGANSEDPAVISGPTVSTTCPP